MGRERFGREAPELVRREAPVEPDHNRRAAVFRFVPEHRRQRAGQSTNGVEGEFVCDNRAPAVSSEADRHVAPNCAALGWVNAPVIVLRLAHRVALGKRLGRCARLIHTIGLVDAVERKFLVRSRARIPNKFEPIRIIIQHHDRRMAVMLS